MTASPEQIEGQVREVALAVQVGKIEEKLDGTDRKLDAIHASLKRDLVAVETQTTATNGRVSQLERKQAELKGIGIAFLALSPFVLFVLQRLTAA